MKPWMIIGAVLLLVGVTLFLWAMSSCSWDLSRLSTVKLVSNTHKITEDFTGISIVTDVSDIAILPSEDGKCRVECCEMEKAVHSVAVEDGVLNITNRDERKWYERIGINFSTPKITVYLAETEYAYLCVKETTGDVLIDKAFTFESIELTTTTGDIKSMASSAGNVKIKASTGDVMLEGISAGSLDVTVTTGCIKISSAVVENDITLGISTGSIKLADVECGSLSSEGTTGDLRMKNVIANGTLSVTRSTGDVSFDGCDASEIHVKTTTGDITGSLLSDKVFFAQATTGDVSVPKTTRGGKCELSATTGDIEIKIK